jgi:hypothetical protein
MSDEPCDDCRKDRIRIGIAAAIVAAAVTAAAIVFVFPGKVGN